MGRTRIQEGSLLPDLRFQLCRPHFLDLEFRLGLQSFLLYLPIIPVSSLYPSAAE
jgi:hypothetical protein